MCQIGEADVDVSVSDEETAERLIDRKQEGAPLEKDAVKVRIFIHHPQT